MNRIVATLIVLTTVHASWAGSPKVVARFSYTVPAMGSVPEILLDAGRRRPALYRVTAHCFDGSVPGGEPDPVVHYVRYEDQTEADESACDNAGDPIFVAPDTPIVFKPRFPGSITTGLKGVLVLERVTQFE